MEYEDYKTGEPISREQYIKNGLERGELLVKEDCGCVIIQDRTAGAYIVYCHKHKATQALYEAAKEVMDTLEQYGGSIVPHLMDTDENSGQRLREALAKAEGRE